MVSAIQIILRGKALWPLCLWCCLFLLGCQEKALSPKRFLQWVENEKNGLLCREESAQYKYTFLLKPKAYVVMKNKWGEISDLETMEIAQMEFEDLNYGSLWLEMSDGSNPVTYNKAEKEEMGRRSMYCSFGIQHDLLMIEGSDTLHCVFAHWEQTSGISNRLHFILAFEESRNHSGQEKVIWFHNRLMGEESIAFRIDATDLKRIPSLKF